MYSSVAGQQTSLVSLAWQFFKANSCWGLLVVFNSWVMGKCFQEMRGLQSTDAEMISIASKSNNNSAKALVCLLN